MAQMRSRSLLAPLLAVAAALCLACRLSGRSGAFVPAPPALRGQLALQAGEAVQAVSAAALVAAATAPMPALALEDEDEGFDIRILAILVLPLVAISWALFNVWRVAFRQVVRIGETASGSSKIGLKRED
mmetsp:Transcript_99942/g.322245  ORF Transcript_99942/g.322245 Transcript_99942/m.322245 type:complete len:130 (+) Transcript_99942:61-450(+)